MTHRHARGERGAVAVEFALVSVILVTLLLGIIQFSLWFWAWQVGSHAAREASRVGAVDPCNTAKISDTGIDRLNGTPGNGKSVTVNRPAGGKVGEVLTVTIKFNAVDLGFFPGFTGAVDKRATTRIEYVPTGATC